LDPNGISDSFYKLLLIQMRFATKEHPMSSEKPTRRSKGFDELRKPIVSDPVRSARVDEHKAAMLGELRRKLDLTQTAVAERLDVTQENVSQIERGAADSRLSTLSRYVEALGGRLEVRAVFPEAIVALTVGHAATLRHQIDGNSKHSANGKSGDAVGDKPN
jgi:DNA-binding XRE family transcriptional regulator